MGGGYEMQGRGKRTVLPAEATAAAFFAFEEGLATLQAVAADGLLALVVAAFLCGRGGRRTFPGGIESRDVIEGDREADGGSGAVAWRGDGDRADGCGRGFHGPCLDVDGLRLRSRIGGQDGHGGVAMQGGPM